MHPDTVRQQLEAREAATLSPYAARSADATRATPMPDCDIRTAFQRDRDRILHSKAFRRLKHKTQVFIAPLGDHYRTRLTHTLEVTQIARTVARALRLNEDLTEAIGLGHDIGHPPFGHAGEAALARAYGKSFRHNAQSRRILEVLEWGGQGLNLTHQVMEGIELHSKARRDITAQAWGTASTLEGQIIKLTDSIAYINHDIDDAVRAGIITQDQLPHDCIALLGQTHGERINTMVTDLIRTSWWATGEGDPPAEQVLSMSEPVLHATNTLREYMFTNVYLASRAKDQDEKVSRMIGLLYDHYRNHPDELPAEIRTINAQRGEPMERAVLDYIAGMTDRYAIAVFEKLFVPHIWSG